MSSFRWHCSLLFFRSIDSFFILSDSLSMCCRNSVQDYFWFFYSFQFFLIFAPCNCWCAPFQAIVNAKTKFDSNLLCFAFTRSNSIRFVCSIWFCPFVRLLFFPPFHLHAGLKFFSFLCPVLGIYLYFCKCLVRIRFWFARLMKVHGYALKSTSFPMQCNAIRRIEKKIKNIHTTTVQRWKTKTKLLEWEMHKLLINFMTNSLLLSCIFSYASLMNSCHHSKLNWLKEFERKSPQFFFNHFLSWNFFAIIVHQMKFCISELFVRNLILIHFVFLTQYFVIIVWFEHIRENIHANTLISFRKISLKKNSSKL